MPRKSTKAIPWTDADLERLSQITPEDLQQAAELWRENSTRPSLLDAQPDDLGNAGSPTPKK